MKTTLRFAFLLFCALPVLLQAQKTSNLVVFSENGEAFFLSIDGVKQNQEAQNNVRAEGLTGDFHKITVEFNEKELGIVNQNFMLEPGTEQKAQISLKKNGKWVVRPFGEPIALKESVQMESSPIPAPPSVIHASETAPQKENVTTTTTTVTSPAGTGESIDMSIGIGGESIGVSVRVNDGSVSQSTTTTVTESRSETTMVSEEPAEREVIVDDCAPMATGDFQSALQSLKSKTFSDSRMTQAKQILKSNCLSADQVKSTMSLFEYEDDKLEFAKYAYDRCADPENFWKVNDAFEFEMTIDELNEFIESK
jgi:hypothetical protein